MKKIVCLTLALILCAMFTMAMADPRVGDVVYFGSYPQYRNSETRSPIEWLVVKTDGSDLMLLSRYSLDTVRFSEDTQSDWEHSSIRRWLNGSFFNMAFDSNEQRAVIETTVFNGYGSNKESFAYGGRDTTDKVYLLSYEEAGSFFFTDQGRRCQPTEYAVSKGAYREGGTGWYWLRSPGPSYTYAARVQSNGNLGYSIDVHHLGGGVRPVIWVNSSAVSY